MKIYRLEIKTSLVVFGAFIFFYVLVFNLRSVGYIASDELIFQN